MSCLAYCGFGSSITSGPDLILPNQMPPGRCQRRSTRPPLELPAVPARPPITAPAPAAVETDARPESRCTAIIAGEIFGWFQLLEQSF